MDIIKPWNSLPKTLLDFLEKSDAAVTLASRLNVAVSASLLCGAA